MERMQAVDAKVADFDARTRDRSRWGTWLRASRWQSCLCGASDPRPYRQQSDHGASAH